MSDNEQIIWIDGDDDPIVEFYDIDCDSYNGSSSHSDRDDKLNESTYRDVFESTDDSGEVFSDEGGSDSGEYTSFVHELKNLELKKTNIESFLNGCWVFALSGVKPAAGHPDPESNDNNDVELNDLGVIPGDLKMGKNRRTSYFLRRRRWVVRRRFLLFVVAVTISIVIFLFTTHIEDPTAVSLPTDGTVGGSPLPKDHIVFPTAVSLPTDDTVGGSPDDTVGGSPLPKDYIDLEDVLLTNETKSSSLSSPSNNSGATNHNHHSQPNLQENPIFEVHYFPLGGKNDPIPDPSAADQLEGSELVVEP